jgi:hypothetical protein
MGQRKPPVILEHSTEDNQTTGARISVTWSMDRAGLLTIIYL